jgi:hypothetical protein
MRPCGFVGRYKPKYRVQLRGRACRRDGGEGIGGQQPALIGEGFYAYAPVPNPVAAGAVRATTVRLSVITPRKAALSRYEGGPVPQLCG